MNHILFIHSSVDGHLGFFHVLAIVSSTVMNTGIHVSFRIVVFSGYVPSSGVAGSYSRWPPHIEEEKEAQEGGDLCIVMPDLVKAMVFPVVMYGCESWTIKKAEHQRIDAFKLWCWRRLLRVPWKARRSNQSILKEINPEYSLEGLMLKLKFHYLGHLMQRADSLGKEPYARKDWGQGEKGVTEDGMVGWHH